MRKKIFIIGSLLFIEIVLILLTVSHLQILINNLDFYYNHAPHLYEPLTTFYPKFAAHLSYAILAIIANLLNITLIVVTLIKDFPVFKPLADKLAAKRAAREEQRAEQAVVAKQAKIDKLQTELDKLKNDDIE